MYNLPCDGLWSSEPLMLSRSACNKLHWTSAASTMRRAWRTGSRQPRRSLATPLRPRKRLSGSRTRLTTQGKVVVVVVMPMKMVVVLFDLVVVVVVVVVLVVVVLLLLMMLWCGANDDKHNRESSACEHIHAKLRLDRGLSCLRRAKQSYELFYNMTGI